jgi:hypothetical protein
MILIAAILIRPMHGASKMRLRPTLTLQALKTKTSRADTFCLQVCGDAEVA